MGLVVEFNLGPADLPQWPWDFPGSRGLEGLGRLRHRLGILELGPSPLPQFAPVPAQFETGSLACKTWITGFFYICSEWISVSLLRISEASCSPAYMTSQTPEYSFPVLSSTQRLDKSEHFGPLAVPEVVQGRCGL